MTAMALGQSAAALVLAAGLLGSTTTDGARHCHCQSSWMHTEQKCANKKNGIIGKQMNGCPSLALLADCELKPEQSWCFINESSCFEQIKKQNWSYCEPATQATMLPYCECEPFWKGDEKAADGTTKNMPLQYGCPERSTLEDSGYSMMDKSTTQSWCKTTDKRCFEQDTYQTPAGDVTTNLGANWVFCDANTGEPELPDCECQTHWTVEDEVCKSLDGATVEFDGCPSAQAWESRCANKRNGTGQPWCKTTEGRCKQQSGSNDKYIENMVGQGWSYCTPAAEVGAKAKAAEPTCQCKPHWNNTEGPRCAQEDGNLPILMNGCPELGDIRRCEYEAKESWCVTTYKMCEQQNSEADSKGWSYCDTKTHQGHYAQCECKKSWETNRDECNAEQVKDKKAPHFRGCPKVQDLKELCDTDVEMTWCETKDETCRGQEEGVNWGKGWVECDFSTQLPVNHGNVGATVGITFVVTVVVCIGVFVLFLWGYKKYLDGHRRRYSAELLEPATSGAYENYATHK